MYDCCVVVNFAYARAHYASNALAKSQKPTRARKLAQQQKKATFVRCLDFVFV